jgi:hypothetical protein
MSTEAPAVENNSPVTLAGWKKAAKHYPLLPSGVRVGIKIPDLPALIEAGSIPQHLLDAALGVAAGEEQRPTRELIIQQREFTDRLVMIAVVEPSLSESDVKDIPYEDKEFIVAVATRQRDLDAEGEHIAGLTKSEKFRRFRGLGEFDPTLEGA